MLENPLLTENLKEFKEMIKQVESEQVVKKDIIKEMQQNLHTILNWHMVNE